MIFTPASLASEIAFTAIVGAVLVALLTGVYVATKRELGGGAAKRQTLAVAIGLALYLGLFAFAAGGGVIEAAPMPRLLLTFALANGLGLLLALSPIGGRLARALPLAALVGFQSFRLPLELVLHAWSLSGTIPETMTWTGANVDIVSGVVALVLAPFANRSRRLAWVANLVGIVLLANVARVAMLSSPLPFAWPVEPPLQLLFHLPYALIVPVCVAGAFAGHVVLTRRLWRSS